VNDPRLSRRRFMGVASVGAAAVAGVTGPWMAGSASAATGTSTSGAAGSGASTTGEERPVADAVLAAFRQHQMVAIGEIHGQQEHYDALQALLADPRLPEVVDDIVVEFGNALYQPVMDRFVSGTPVENADLRLVWRNTTQSPGATLDGPMYEQFYRAVRAANWALPAQKRMRVLLGDPPIDWSRVATEDDAAVFGAQRDSYVASLVKREVLDKGRRALICYGSVHVQHAPPGATGGPMMAQIEAETGKRAYVIMAGGHPRLASSPRRVVVPAKGSWLETADTGEFDYLPPHCGVPFGMVADALLYLGQRADQTASLPDPAIYLDPVYWAELQRRNAVMGNHIDLDKQYRQPQSVRWPASSGPNCPPSQQ
jgi:hypothetical protein